MRMRFRRSTFFRLELSYPYWIHLDGGWVIAFDFRSVKMPRLFRDKFDLNFLENGLRKDCREMIHIQDSTRRINWTSLLRMIAPRAARASVLVTQPPSQ
jgi:hypothetical protein